MDIQSSKRKAETFAAPDAKKRATFDTNDEHLEEGDEHFQSEKAILDTETSSDESELEEEDLDDDQLELVYRVEVGGDYKELGNELAKHFDPDTPTFSRRLKRLRKFHIGFEKRLRLQKTLPKYYYTRVYLTKLGYMTVASFSRENNGAKGWF